MCENGRIVLGMRIAELAFATKAGHLTCQKQRDFLRDVLAYAADDVIVREGALDFIALIYVNRDQAADRLFRLLDEMRIGPLSDPTLRPGQWKSMATLEAQPHYAWQDRVDING